LAAAYVRVGKPPDEFGALGGVIEQPEMANSWDDVKSSGAAVLHRPAVEDRGQEVVVTSDDERPPGSGGARAD